jgi:hypothetical protein
MLFKQSFCNFQGIFMICVFKKSLLALGFVFASFAFVSARTVSEWKTQLKEIAQVLLDKNVCDAKIASFASKNTNFKEEELIDLCEQLLFYQKDLGLRAKDVANIQDELISYLRSFVSSGIDLVEIDPNFALIFDEQNPDFTVTFLNPAGEFKTRKYALKVWSVGFKIEVAIKIDAIAIIGGGFNYYDTNKILKLGSGIDLSIAAGPGFDFTYSKIEGVGNCGLLIVAIPVGFGGALSYVFGGEMTPIKE